MGNKVSNENAAAGKEMLDPVDYTKNDSQTPLPELDELPIECRQLQEQIDDLSEAIEDIFEERDDPAESTSALESRLQTMTRNNQLKIHRLHKYLEVHSRRVGVRDNDQVMALVRKLVSIVNSYMSMLMKNIRQLKRLLDERQLARKASSRPSQKRVPVQVDVIPEHVDVDTMLVQLSETEMAREELERDIVCILVYWRDFRELMDAESDNSDVITERVKVQEAAISVSHGMAHLNEKKELK